MSASADSMFADLRDLYSDAIRSHGRHPAHARRPAVFDADARGDNPMCGDRVQVFVRRDGGQVAEAGFEARGCEISVASADLMCEAVAGRTAGEIRALADAVRHLARTGQCPDCDADVASALQPLQPLSAVHEYPSRVKCVTLPWNALLAALDGGKEASSE